MQLEPTRVLTALLGGVHPIDESMRFCVQKAIFFFANPFPCSGPLLFREEGAGRTRRLRRNRATGIVITARLYEAEVTPSAARVSAGGRAGSKREGAVDGRP